MNKKARFLNLYIKNCSFLALFIWQGLQVVFPTDFLYQLWFSS